MRYKHKCWYLIWLSDGTIIIIGPIIQNNLLIYVNLKNVTYELTMVN